jgi:hypothetical protein
MESFEDLDRSDVQGEMLTAFFAPSAKLSTDMVQ